MQPSKVRQRSCVMLFKLTRASLGPGRNGELFARNFIRIAVGILAVLCWYPSLTHSK